MWTTVTRTLSFSGTVEVSLGSTAAPLPLKGVLVDVYRCWLGADGAFQFERLNQAAARTSPTGDFSFSDLPVPVQVQTVIPSIPPYTPMEIINPLSLPNLVFRISVEAEVLQGGVSQGNQFVDVYDERQVVNQDWLAGHPERTNVPLAGAVIAVLIPEGNAVATTLAGMALAPSPVPGKEFHFLRVGRTIRQELGELGDPRPDYAGRAGYMTSSNRWTVAPQPSFFPDVVDAPFGSTLQIGGHFGADLLPLADDLYYTVSFWEYSGILAAPFNPALLTDEVQIVDPLFNKKYILPTPDLPNGQWQTLYLGPFDGTITDVEPPHSPALVGTSVKVYQRPGPQNPITEYWPFWDLMAIWSSTTAPNELVILTLEAYQRTGGMDTNPQLTKLAITSSINGHLPLHIDNRPPVPKLFDWRTGMAVFGPPEAVGGIAPLGECGVMLVTPGQPNGNECLLVRYSVEDGAGSAHSHLAGYQLAIDFSPRQVAGAPTEQSVALRSFGAGLGYQSPAGNYSTALPTAPIYSVLNYESVLVPDALDGWPPEPAGDPPAPCPQYAAEVRLSCWVRTVDGWSTIFGWPHIGRHIIISSV